MVTAQDQSELSLDIERQTDILIQRGEIPQFRPRHIQRAEARFIISKFGSLDPATIEQKRVDIGDLPQFERSVKTKTQLKEERERIAARKRATPPKPTQRQVEFGAQVARAGGLIQVGSEAQRQQVIQAAVRQERKKAQPTQSISLVEGQFTPVPKTEDPIFRKDVGFTPSQRLPKQKVKDPFATSLRKQAERISSPVNLAGQSLPIKIAAQATAAVFSGIAEPLSLLEDPKGFGIKTIAGAKVLIKDPLGTAKATGARAITKPGIFAGEIIGGTLIATPAIRLAKAGVVKGVKGVSKVKTKIKVRSFEKKLRSVEQRAFDPTKKFKVQPALVAVREGKILRIKETSVVQSGQKTLQGTTISKQALQQIKIRQLEGRILKKKFVDPESGKVTITEVERNPLKIPEKQLITRAIEKEGAIEFKQFTPSGKLAERSSTRQLSLKTPEIPSAFDISQAKFVLLTKQTAKLAVADPKRFQINLVVKPIEQRPTVFIPETQKLLIEVPKKPFSAEATSRLLRNIEQPELKLPKEVKLDIKTPQITVTKPKQKAKQTFVPRALQKADEFVIFEEEFIIPRQKLPEVSAISTGVKSKVFIVPKLNIKVKSVTKQRIKSTSLLAAGFKTAQIPKSKLATTQISKLNLKNIVIQTPKISTRIRTVTDQIPDVKLDIPTIPNIPVRPGGPTKDIFKTKQPKTPKTPALKLVSGKKRKTSKRTKKFKLPKRTFKFTPSLKAVELKIKAQKQPKVLTGLEARPIIV